MNKKELLKVVLQTSKFILNIIEEENEREIFSENYINNNIPNLYKSLELYINTELGVKVNVNKDKLSVLYDIKTKYDDRNVLLREYDLEKLEMELYRLDLKRNENVVYIREYIYKEYNIEHIVISQILTKTQIIDIVLEKMNLKV